MSAQEDRAAGPNATSGPSAPASQPVEAPAADAVAVVSWNLTRRCNLRCVHCYLPAGKENDSSHAELDTAELFRVADGIAEVNPEALVILTGGEPLLRPDLFELARRLSGHGMLVVLGSNGVGIDDGVARRLAESGVKGVGLSLDAPAAAEHDLFRGRGGAFEATVRGAEAVRAAGLDLLVQASLARHNVDRLPEMVDLAWRLGAKVFNLYFLVRTGRGRDVEALSPAENDAALQRLYELQHRYRRGSATTTITAAAATTKGAAVGAGFPAYADVEAAAFRASDGMLVHAKCAPQFRRIVFEADPGSALGRTFTGGCPAGQNYCRIDPEGDLTPCPFMPLSVGNLRRERFADLWRGAPLFRQLRERRLGGRCGECEFSLLCGGCRCKAYAATGDPLGEDPSCDYQPGRYGGRVLQPAADAAYSAPVAPTLDWTAEARAKLARVPFFVRGMVTRGVEGAARERGATLVTAALLDELRARMSERTGRVFPGGPGRAQ
ncbi:MAG: radical SAM protein [Planctomycetes bacterium]|nr:radical SAM protein [Planctomycetota bacterium]